MTVINPNSISGITSITLPSGGDNVLTIHTNDGVERFRIDSSGNVKVGSACTISQDGDVFFTGVTTATTFTGAHSGSGANLTGITAPIFGNYAVLMDVKSEGNDGGTFTSGQWQVRDLNTEYYDPDGIVTLSSNIFVLQAGYYFIRFSATAHRVGTHKCVLFRESGTQTIFAHGSSERLVTDGGSNRSEGIWRGQISGTVNLQIRHRCSSTRDNDGLGKASTAGDEIYTIVEIFKEA